MRFVAGSLWPRPPPVSWASSKQRKRYSESATVSFLLTTQLPYSLRHSTAYFLLTTQHSFLPAYHTTHFPSSLLTTKPQNTDSFLLTTKHRFLPPNTKHRFLPSYHTTQLLPSLPHNTASFLLTTPHSCLPPYHKGHIPSFSRHKLLAFLLATQRRSSVLSTK